MCPNSVFIWSAVLLEIAFILAPNVCSSMEQAASMPHAAPSNWCVAGDFQPGGGWNNSSDPLYDDGTHGDVSADDAIFSLQYTILKPASTFEWKIFECGTWNGYPNEGSGNKWLYTIMDNQVVTFTFNTNPLNDGFTPLSNIAMVTDSGNVLTSWTAVGDWQSPPWNNSDISTLMRPIGALNPGVYFLHHKVATPGIHLYYMTSSGSWDRQIGPDGRSVNSSPTGTFTTTVPDQNITFVLDTNRPGIKTVPWHLFLPAVMR